MTNAQRFIAAYNEIDHALREMCCVDEYTPFRTLLKLASQQSSVLKALKIDLQEFAELRNAIVHQSRQGAVIAEPADWAVEQIERMSGLLTDPPMLLPFCQGKVLTFAATDSVGHVLKLMSKHRFSQAPVYSGRDYLGLVTTDSLIFWLGTVMASGSDWAGAPVKEVIEAKQIPAEARFLPKDASLCDLVDAFHKSSEQGKRLDAVLVTETGSSRQSLLGIATAWDLPQIYEAVGVM